MALRLAIRKPTPSSSSVPVTTSTGGFYAIALRPVSACQSRIEAVPAARLVKTRGAHQHAVAARDEPLSMVGRIATHDTDGQRLGDVLRDREQLRHRLKRAAEIVLIEPRDDD